MRSLAIIALLIGCTSPALAQNAPPTNGYPPPPPGTSGTPATYGPPAPGVIPGAPGPVYRITGAGGRKASIIGTEATGAKEAVVGRSTAACQDEARRIAANIAELPELVRKP